MTYHRAMRIRALLFLLACAAYAQNSSSPAGKWIFNLKYVGENNYERLQLDLNGNALTGKMGNNPFEGTFRNGRIEGTVKTQGQTFQLEGTLAGDRMQGTATVVEMKVDLKWEAYREPAKSSDPPKTHTFEPTAFHHFFADDIDPALHIRPGDTVKTWSVDAGGPDPQGVRRTTGGNPLTGPFY